MHVCVLPLHSVCMRARVYVHVRVYARVCVRALLCGCNGMCLRVRMCSVGPNAMCRVAPVADGHKISRTRHTELISCLWFCQRYCRRTLPMPIANHPPRPRAGYALVVAAMIRMGHACTRQQ